MIQSKSFTIGIRICLMFLLVSFFGSTKAQIRTQPIEGELIVQLVPKASVDQLIKLTNSAHVDLHLSVERLLSAHCRIWHLKFDYRSYSTAEALSLIQMSPLVFEAQLNRKNQSRATQPNDPLISEQWQHVNTGALGGTVDADIDADEAWDITTGGTTVFGDTIVVCVIDDGVDSDHYDIVENLWINHGEVPQNGFDDDQNGYIDDYLGWNTYDFDDDITDDNFGGFHGSAVAGIVGAKGNNGIGVTGVNWNVKLMIVVGGGDEADAIAAYDYPLTQRRLYNETGGTKGAFVVATNSSWGQDFGRASDAPLWCAMYDSMGKYGILSAGATINGNTNVDIDGDLPTTCPSKYLISVTNTDDRDEKLSFAGFGATHIDLGAPGEGAYTIDAGNNYGGFGGTSAATPHVAGTIGLAYASPCPGFLAQAIRHPDSAAILMRSFILDGVDSNTSLEGITVTEGRLNTYNTLLNTINYDCAFDGCLAPFAIQVATNQLNEASVSWRSLAPTDYELRYRRVGSASWNTLSTNDSSLLISGLAVCATYELEMRSICDTLESDYSTKVIFTSDGCCNVPLDFESSFVSETSVTINWTTVSAASSYNLFYRQRGNATWNLVNNAQPPFELSGLDSCVLYEFQITSDCDTAVSPVSDSILVTTTGCGSCQDANFCSISMDAGAEFIASVELNNISNSSGSDGGYGDYTQHTTVLFVDSTYEIALTPGYSGFSFSEYFKVYIDYNQDGDFNEQTEVAFDAGTLVQATVRGDFTIPPTALTGSSRMRVVMRFDLEPDACELSGNFGETEDYCVTIQRFTNSNTSVSQLEDREISVYPSLVRDRFFIGGIVSGESLEYELRSIDGRKITSGDIKTSGSAPIRILPNVRSGVLIVSIFDGTQSKSFRIFKFE